MFIAIFAILLFQADSLQSVIVESSRQLFRTAVSISSAPDGRLFVIDQAVNMLYEISDKNSITKTIGGKGWGNDAFDLPCDIVSSFLLDIVVVDENNRRVQRYDKQLNYAQTYDEQALSTLSGRFQPIAAATSIQGELFILEIDSKRVIVLNQRGTFQREIGTFKESRGKLIEPKDIAVSSRNEVFVLDAKAVMVFDCFGNFLRSIPISPKEEWKTVSLSENAVIVTSSSRIEIIAMDTNKQMVILPKTIMGAEVTEPFSDALLQGSTLVILTKTSLYRCTFPE
jgi:hypothetical protein